MFLKKFIYVNWGNIPNIEFDFGPVNLFSGGNGSGKTTAADALQTIMTAAHENLFQFNPGQDETTQRGRGGKRVRTLASYVLGCDDGSYARLQPSDGYLAAVFHPTKGETSSVFTAIIGVRAWLDNMGNLKAARQDSPEFFIIPDEQLSLSHFVREDQAGKYVVPLDSIYKKLSTEFGHNKVERYDTKKTYLRRLYAALRGRSDSVPEIEAVSAARAFSRFMAYKPVQSINKFVREEILEKKDLGEAIRSISAQLKTIHSMERDAAQLLESIDILQQANNQSQKYIEHWIELNTIDYSIAQYNFLSRQRAYVQAKKQQSDYRHALTQNTKDTELAHERRKQIHEQLVSLEAQRRGIAKLQDKDKLQQQQESHHSQLVLQATQLLQEGNQLEQNDTHTNNIFTALQSPEIISELPSLADLNTSTLAQQVLSKGKKGNIDFTALMNQDFLNELSQLENHLDHAREAQSLHNQWYDHWHNDELSENSEPLKDVLARLCVQRENKYQQLEAQKKQKQQEIERLNAHKINYPPFVERALDAIHRQCPQAEPRVLCEHIEVIDQEWQSSIEGYLGGARFSIIVEQQYEAEAIRIVRSIPGRDNKARIIQGYKAQRDAERIQIDSDSIINVMEFSHATARHYLVASYGRVQRVESAEALKQVARGLTADGMGAGNYSLWRCDLPDSELVFGAGARERALVAKQEELNQIVESWQVTHDALLAARDLLTAVNSLKQLSHADTMTQMLSIHRELQETQNLLTQLDLGEHEVLENKLDEFRSQEQHWTEQEGNLKEQKGELQEKLRKVSEQCKFLSKQQDETQAVVERCEESLRVISQSWTDLDCDQKLDAADQEARELNLEFANNQRQDIEQQLHASERNMDRYIQQHNQQCRPNEVILYQFFENAYDKKLFDNICRLQKDIDTVYNQLKNNILVEKHSQLTQLKESFNNAFVTHLCHAIHQAISNGKRQIEQLNKELQHHRFGADREMFRFASDWIPEYRDYSRFFEEVIKNPRLGDGQTLFDIELSKKSQKVRDNLMEMLLDEDEQKALRELERLADYRNYHQYEIFKDVEGKPPIPLSEYGTGSGGQLETPAYIIRSAAITSAFRFSEGNNHLRMVLVDEAFSKMDETRSREVINYLTEALGLQLVFIMPTSKCGPFMDLISNEFVFAKCPSEVPRGELHTRVLVDRKQCNQEKIKNLWAKHRRTVRHQAELDFMEEVLA